MSRRQGLSTLSNVVRKLREHALAHHPGSLIGSEDQLVTLYGVSRPTLRQAAALVTQEQLLQVRRGVGGGYFAQRPDARAVSHMSAIYLQAHATRLDEIIRAVEPIRVEMTILSAQNRDGEILNAWKEFQKRDRCLQAEGGYRTFLSSEREFGHLLGRACQNTVLALFLDTLHTFSARIKYDKDVYRDHPDRVQEFWQRRSAVIDAIIDGDAEIAALLSRRCEQLVVGWMQSSHDASQVDLSIADELLSSR